MLAQLQSIYQCDSLNSFNVKAESPYGSLAQIKETGETNNEDGLIKNQDIYQTQLLNNSEENVVKNSDNNSHIINGNCRTSRVTNSLDRAPGGRSVTIAEPPELNTFRSASNSCSQNIVNPGAQDYNSRVENSQMPIQSNNNFPTIPKNPIAMVANTPHFPTITSTHFSKVNRGRQERNEVPSSFECDELET